MIENKFSFLGTGKAKYTGFPEKAVDFITSVQLKDKALWDKCVGVFGTDIDVQDHGWRGEFFGKTMRGGCIVYQYSADEELYDVLEYAVKNLLDKQEPSGRISTYDVQNEFCGWDMWARKYILVGLQYFYDICKDKQLKERILDAMIKHADYIIDHVGEGKKPIKKTTEIYDGLNSCSILDAFLQLYKLTGFTRYTEFGEYVIKERSDMIKCVEEGKLKAHQFPETKAYEMMSFFEGLLTYYEITGKEYYFNLVIKFFDGLEKTENTIIGGMGTAGEFFDNSVEKQTEYSTSLMLETCVTVTLIRVLTRLLMLTGDGKYADRIEISTYNALYGAINFNLLPQYSFETKRMMNGMPFDSYATLVANKRGVGIGGFKQFADGTYDGCCASIGSAGIGLFPLTSVVAEKDGIAVNYFINGSATAKVSSGTVNVTIDTEYPKNGEITVKLLPDFNGEYSVKIRIPKWANANACLVGLNQIKTENGYLVMNNLSGIKKIKLSLPLIVKGVRRNGKTAFVKGPIVLCRDEEKEQRKIDFEKTAELEKTDKGYIFKTAKTEGDETARYTVKTADGEMIVLSDYATCGRNWTGELPNISVWLNVK